MISYTVRRFLHVSLVILGIATIVFIVTRVIPADPIGAILGPQAPPEAVERVRKEYGFDKPIYQQYIDYMYNLFRGNLGMSIATNRPVIYDIAERFMATLELSAASLIIALIIGIPVGIISALKKDTVYDYVLRVVSLFGTSMPVFWFGLMLLIIFYYTLGLLPGPGRLDPWIEAPPRITGMITVDSLLTGNLKAFSNAVSHLVLPATVLGFYAASSVARITRASVLEIIKQDHVRTARAKGIPKLTILSKHIIRPALIPIITVIGLVSGGLLEGAVLTETVFGWPGLGSYLARAMIFMDYNAVVGGVVFVALIYSLINLVVDLIYTYLDPRIKLR